jgi:hypothetical protein
MCGWPAIGKDAQSFSDLCDVYRVVPKARKSGSCTHPLSAYDHVQIERLDAFVEQVVERV